MTRPAPIELSEPATYLPFLSARYDVKPGLRRLGVDLGNGAADGLLFQIDRDFPRYRAAKLAARRQLGRCFVTQEYPPHVAAAVNAFLVDRLAREHPALFGLCDSRTLECRITGETLRFGGDWSLRHAVTHAEPPYADALDALGANVQEDLAVTVVDGPRHWLAALHVCLPSHWDPRRKIGGSFAEVHTTVPGMTAMNQRQGEYVRQMVEATDGLVRFVWGIQRGDALNRHPDLPTDDAGAWHVRVERQTIWGLPHAGASLFLIRPYLVTGEAVRGNPAWLAALIEALRGMSEEAAAYKGLLHTRPQIIEWLSSTA